ncbi:hypothetical protein M3J09_008652 [Ascochyta lentis]
MYPPPCLLCTPTGGYLHSTPHTSLRQRTSLVLCVKPVP